MSRPVSRLITLAVLSVLFAAVSAPSAQAAPFAPGNVVIYRVGNGTDPLVSSGSPVFLDEYTPTGTLIQSIPLPTTDPAGDNRQLVASGTATSEGLLTRTADGRHLLATGYGRDFPPPQPPAPAPAPGSLSGTASAEVNRVIGRIDGSGAVDTTTALSDFADGNNPRSAASPDGTTLLGAGGAGGVRFKSGLGAGTSTQLNTDPPTNLRQIAVFDGQLYVSTASGNTVRIGRVGTGVPTMPPPSPQITNLPGFPTTGSPYGFAFVDLSPSVAGVDTLYVADDGASGGQSGQIQKYTLSGGNWVADGTIAAAAVRGLTARVQGTTVSLFGTTGGILYGATDTSGYDGTLTASVSQLASAGANTAFRGVAFAPTTPPPAGNVVVNELRGSATGPADDYVNLFNRSSSPIDVSGWTVRTQNNDGGTATSLQIPSVPVVPPKGRLLVTNQQGYSLGLGASTLFDRFFGADLPSDGAVQLIDGSATTQDAARFAGGGTGEGNSLGTFASTDQYAFLRIANRTGTGANYGLPKDSGDNASDFRLVTAGAVGTGGSVLPAFEGVPGPVNSLGPPLANGAVRVERVDAGAAANAPPNREVRGTPGPNGTLYLRRKITNTSGAPLTSLRFRASDLTAVRSDAPAGLAQLRLVGSDNTSVTGPSGTATITSVHLDSTAAAPQTNGGGLNAVVTVPSVTGGSSLANGASINVEFALRIVQPGSFSAIFNTEAR